jgi:hypothetical protein
MVSLFAGYLGEIGVFIPRLGFPFEGRLEVIFGLAHIPAPLDIV